MRSVAHYSAANHILFEKHYMYFFQHIITFISACPLHVAKFDNPNLIKQILNTASCTLDKGITYFFLFYNYHSAFSTTK